MARARLTAARPANPADGPRDSCRRNVEAIADANDGVDCLLRGLDVYAGFYAESTPIVRVLASEALRLESPLGAMRLELIDRTIELYCRRFQELEGRALDPSVVRALVLMSEAVNLHMVTTTATTEADVNRVHAAIHHVVERAAAPDPT